MFLASEIDYIKLFFLRSDYINPLTTNNCIMWLSVFMSILAMCLGGRFA